MNLFFMMFKSLVKFTPTQKDDAALEKIEKFVGENPEVLDFIEKLMTKKSSEK